MRRRTGEQTVDAQKVEKEFAEHLTREQSRLFGYIHSLVRDLDDADDLFQQTTLVLWKKFAEFDRSRSFFSWACGVARLEVANFLRSRARHRLYFSDELNLLLVEAQESDTPDDEAARAALAGCLEKLRPRDRELLDECYGDPGGVAGAAARTGRLTQSVHNSLRRIRRALFECVERSLARQDRPGWLA